MEPDFWHARWRENQIGFHRDRVSEDLMAHWPSVGVAPGAEVFVPLCGKSRDLAWLHEQGHGVLGVELSAQAVDAFFVESDLPAGTAEAGAFRISRHGRLKVLCGDFFDLEPSDLSAVQAVYDRASLVAFPPQGRARYAAHLLACVPREAPILLVTLEYPQEQMNGPPFSVPDAEVEALFGRSHVLRRLDARDVLDGEPRFRARGLSRLIETVWLLTPRGGAA